MNSLLALASHSLLLLKLLLNLPVGLGFRFLLLSLAQLFLLTLDLLGLLLQIFELHLQLLLSLELSSEHAITFPDEANVVRVLLLLLKHLLSSSFLAGLAFTLHNSQDLDITLMQLAALALLERQLEDVLREGTGSEQRIHHLFLVKHSTDGVTHHFAISKLYFLASKE